MLESNENKCNIFSAFKIENFDIKLSLNDINSIYLYVNNQNYSTFQITNNYIYQTKTFIPDINFNLLLLIKTDNNYSNFIYNFNIIKLTLMIIIK